MDGPIQNNLIQVSYMGTKDIIVDFSGKINSKSNMSCVDELLVYLVEKVNVIERHILKKKYTIQMNYRREKDKINDQKTAFKIRPHWYGLTSNLTNAYRAWDLNIHAS